MNSALLDFFIKQKYKVSYKEDCDYNKIINDFNNRNFLILLIGGVATEKSTFIKNILNINSEIEKISVDKCMDFCGKEDDAEELVKCLIKECYSLKKNFLYEGIIISDYKRKPYILEAKENGYIIIGIDFGAQNKDYLEQRIKAESSFDWKGQSEQDKRRYLKPKIDEGFDLLVDVNSLYQSTFWYHS